MKRITALFLAVMLCLCLTACSKETAPEENEQENEQEIRIAVTNTVKKSVTGLGVTWYLADQPFHSTGMQATDGKEIENNTVEFVLNREDVPQNADLNEFGVKFVVKETSDVELDVCTLHFPVEFGKQYAFELRSENDSYVIWAESDGSIHGGDAAEKPEESEEPEKPVQQSIELVGPWHLDSERNDLAAFADSLDLFPGYGEWGACMEIRSDGRINWYIGAAGGYGIYTIEDDLLHAELVDSIDQKDMEMDFRILVENEKAVLEMDYQDMTIYWVYGDQEDAPAIGNDESQNETSYPGADVVEIVNLRGDEATIYKLADGTYMDRIERRFTYNGTDIWTDENGVEWNEAVKD